MQNITDEEKDRLQKIFDRAYSGLKSQDFRTSLMLNDCDGNMYCAYRGEGGVKCAIGHLIPDESYLPKFEGEIVNETILRAIAIGGIEIDPGDKKAEIFLSRLQMCHDHNKNDPGRMQQDLLALARHFNLTTSEA